MKKTILITTLIFNCLIINFQLTAQPTIQWQKSLGGSNTEWANDIKQTFDGGYIVCGVSSSSDGDVTINKGNSDYWVVKLDANGVIEWQKTYGGSLDEGAYSISQTNDGGYIVSGFSNSNDGDATINKGTSDCWVIKLDNLGNLEWEKSYGGSAGENANSIKQTIDGGYVFAGFSGSLNGDISAHHGGVSIPDFWVVKIDALGNLIWEKSYGGTSYEYAFDIQLTQDDGYIVAGKAKSTDGDVTNNNGGEDYWLIKIDSLGNLIWQKNYGGSGNDIANDVKPTIDGGYIVAGTSNSNNGDVSNSKGGDDMWVVKIDSIGNLLWEKSYGGTNHDAARSITVTLNNNYVVFGETRSIDGDVTINKGGDDYWLIKINSIGTLLWEKTMGGTSFDDGNSMFQTADNGFVVAGGNASNDGDITGYKGGGDFWVVKLNPVVGINELDTNQLVSIYPNPSSGIFNLNTDVDKGNIEVIDLLGSIVLKQTIQNKQTIINLKQQAKGIYFIKLVLGSKVVTEKIIYK